MGLCFIIKDTSIIKFVLSSQFTDIDDICDVEDLLQDELARCYNIGSRLRLRPSTIATIKKEASDLSDAMTMILTNWLQHNYNVERFGPPTWKALVEAVKAPNGGNNTALAEEIARKHPRLTPPGKGASKGASHTLLEGARTQLYHR